MNPFHRRLVPTAALLCLATLLLAVGLLLAACGGQTSEQAPTEGGQTVIETGPAAPTALQTGLEPVSPLEPGRSPLPTATGAPETEADKPPTGAVPIEITLPATTLLTGEVPQDLLDAVLDDLAEQQDASRDVIEIEQAGAVTWRDGSLGCPQPGMMYTQALVPGYQIVLRVGGEIFDYHASDGGTFLLCPAGMADEPLPPAEGGVVDR